MRVSKIALLCLLLLISSLSITAQEFNAPPESGRMFALSMASGSLSIGEKPDVPPPFGTTDVDWNPIDPTRWLRVDNVGILRFVPDGGIGEGVYTFAPFHDGFQVGNAVENKVFVREAEWSPNGEMLVFRTQNDANPDLNQGVWFWQPIRELATDPSYQILRHCPPFCTAAGTPEGASGWRSTSLEWSSDNDAILIGLRLLGENRGALEIRYARRDSEQTQAGTGINPLYYDYGYWANDGQRIIVSGRDPDGQVMFGSVDRSGNAGIIIPASEIGMAWVQNAAQTLEGRYVMLGSATDNNSPLQIVTDDGQMLTPPIGSAPPDVVKWSPDRSAVYLRIGANSYVAQIDGTVYDITEVTANSPNIAWVDGYLPMTLTPTVIPAPIAAGTVTTPSTNATPVTFTIGMLLRVADGTVDIYAEPVGDATIIGTLTPNDELIITAGPIDDGTASWYRVQSLNYTGWIRNTQYLVVPEN